LNASSPIQLTVSDIHKHFDMTTRRVEVLRGISFQMKQGDSLAIIGPSGSGKSSLLHVLGTLEPPSAGLIEINNTNPFLMAEPQLAKFRNDVIGFVFQDHHLLPQYSVLENVLIPTLAFRNSGEGKESRARKLLSRVGLSDRLDHRPAELSGGERQRVAVARALINHPSVLLCDEPTGNLDHASANAVASLLFELHEEEKNILIVVTHSLHLAARFPRRFELKEGKCVEA